MFFRENNMKNVKTCQKKCFLCFFMKIPRGLLPWDFVWCRCILCLIYSIQGNTFIQVFHDIGDALLIHQDHIERERFLGKGAFGAVYSGKVLDKVSHLSLIVASNLSTGITRMAASRSRTRPSAQHLPDMLDRSLGAMVTIRVQTHFMKNAEENYC